MQFGSLKQNAYQSQKTYFYVIIQVSIDDFSNLYSEVARNVQ